MTGPSLTMHPALLRRSCMKATNKCRTVCIRTTMEFHCDLLPTYPQLMKIHIRT